MISRNNLSGLCMWLCASPQNSLSIGPFTHPEKHYFLRFPLAHLQFVFSLAPKETSSPFCSLYTICLFRVRHYGALADGGLTPFTFSFGIVPLYSIPTLFIC